MPVPLGGDRSDVAGLAPSRVRVWVEALDSHAGDRRKARRVARERRLDEHRRPVFASQFECHPVPIEIPRAGQFDDRVGALWQRLQGGPDKDPCGDGHGHHHEGQADPAGAYIAPTDSAQNPDVHEALPRAIEHLKYYVARGTVTRATQTLCVRQGRLLHPLDPGPGATSDCRRRGAARRQGRVDGEIRDPGDAG